MTLPRTHLFICGLHRSGTSALHEILKLHPAITGFSGTGKPKDEGQHLQSVIGVDGNFGGPGDFCFHDGAHLTEWDVGAYQARLPKLMSSWEALWAPDRPIRVEKSPPNLIRSRFLQAVFGDARFVFIVRHPLAVARATRKWSHASEEYLFRHWLEGHRLMMEDAPHIQRSCCIRYEDLAADLNGTLERVWRVAETPGLTVHGDSFSDHNPNYLDASARFQLSAVELKLLASFGYELEPPFTRFDQRFGW
ncbi:MAG: sulfotransferase [Alphaproteobacteria bacterium]|nr:sulfotransferase [Alphaproteobacteria bacterium]